MCKNIAKSATATEAKPNILTQITDIDGRVPHRWPRSRSEHVSSSGRKEIWLLSRPLFKTHIKMSKENAKQVPFKTLSRPPYMDRTPNNEESLVISDHESSEQTQPLELLTEAPQEDMAAEFETPFKTLHINGIWVSGEKNIKETHFKTIINSTQGSREQHRQKLTPFKDPWYAS